MAEKRMATVYLLGRQCTVPDDLTIMRAMEYAGFRLVRGCGCRSGFCGACAVVYRLQGLVSHSQNAVRFGKSACRRERSRAAVPGNL